MYGQLVCACIDMFNKRSDMGATSFLSIPVASLAVYLCLLFGLILPVACIIFLLVC